MSPSRSRRTWLQLAALGTLGGLASACQSAVRSPLPSTPTATPKDPAAPPVALAVANSELVVGPNRFLLAILEHGRPVAQAAVRLEFFEVEGQTATKRADAAATFRSAAGDARGLYVARTQFDRPGAWGVQATATRSDQPPIVARTGFNVLPQASAPLPGTPAIASQHLTRAGVTNLADICSAQPACTMHELSIADALARRRPLVISFATPGYCTSQTCAPVNAEVQKVQARRGAEADFVHVEIYRDPRNLVVADAVNEWGLRSEPWVFVVDRDGLIADRLESVTTADELEASLAPVL